MVSIVEHTHIDAPVERCFYLSLNIDLHQDSTAQTRERAIDGITSGVIGLGECVTWSGRHFGIMLRHTSEITAYAAPTFFEDAMVSGVFRSFRHRHFFRPEGNCTVMKDNLEFAAPVPVLGKIAEALVLKEYLRCFLRERNAFIKQVAESEEWRKYLPV
ncbi:SRPBCC family protein [Acidobacterium sp. S8]|uniref:SRPBCC family protein n=1 Tax=Acidobacterium sp. S8 TaxID=1641854 RepID=UPI00131D9912|nr:SRPBCC family protein [Acidobacterium sp. S8]